MSLTKLVSTLLHQCKWSRNDQRGGEEDKYLDIVPTGNLCEGIVKSANERNFTRSVMSLTKLVSALLHQCKWSRNDQRGGEEDKYLDIIPDESFQAGDRRHPRENQEGTTQVLVNRSNELILLIDAKVRVEEDATGQAGGYASAECGEADLFFSRRFDATVRGRQSSFRSKKMKSRLSGPLYNRARSNNRTVILSYVKVNSPQECNVVK